VSNVASSRQVTKGKAISCELYADKIYDIPGAGVIQILWTGSQFHLRGQDFSSYY
jgi:hypothetical protein